MTCYICGAPATSVEHAPAKSFFPVTHRTNLITVKSCATHNEQTSLDDEYVRNVIAMSIYGNPEGFQLFNSKVVRSLQNSAALTSLITDGAIDISVNDEILEKSLPTKALKLDRERIDLVMRKISYAIYYHKFESQWNRELLIVTDYLVNADNSPDEYGEVVREMRPLIPTFTYEGQNPDVFQYHFVDGQTSDANDKTLIMKFYDGVEFWAYPKQNSTGPKLT